MLACQRNPEVQMNLVSNLLVLSLLAVLLITSTSSALPENPSSTAQPPSQLILSMNAAIAMAVQKNIDLQIEAQNSKMATVESIRSRGIYNPILNVSGTGGVSAIPGEAFFSTKNMTTNIGLTQYIPTGGNISASTQSGYFSYEPTTTPSKEWQSTAGIAFSQPLLKNAGMETFELNITLSATSLQESLERFSATTNDTVSSVITSYNRLYVLRQILETRGAALFSVQSLLDGIKKKAQGAAQDLEVANAEFAIAQRRKDFIEATRNVSDQETNLRYLIGLENPLHIVPSDPPSKSEPSETEDQAINAALELRYDLKQLKSNLHSAELQERVARHQSLPDLSINASGGFTGTGYNFGESYQRISSHPGTFWSAGMQFSVPLGNTTAHNDYIKSKIRKEQVENQIKALKWRIKNDVDYDMRALISARLQVQLADKSSQFAEQRLDQYRKSNLQNLASIQDVLNAENDLNVARNSQLEAVETFSNAVTKLWKDTGLLLDHHGVHIDVSQPGKITDNRESEGLITTPIPAEAAQATEKPATGNGVTSNAVTTLKNVPASNKTYTLIIGVYLSKSVMADAIAKIKSVGLVPIIKQGPEKKEQVTRLYFAKYQNQLQAQKALKKLQSRKADGFILLNEKQQHVVYASSFADQSSALKEQARLAGLGIKVSLEKTTTSLPTFLLSAGNFLGREAALKYAKDLEQQGLKSIVSENP